MQLTQVDPHDLARIRRLICVVHFTYHNTPSLVACLEPPLVIDASRGMITVHLLILPMSFAWTINHKLLAMTHFCTSDGTATSTTHEPIYIDSSSLTCLKWQGKHSNEPFRKIRHIKILGFMVNYNPIKC